MGSSSRTAAADCGEISALGWLALILLFLKHMNNHATQSLCTWALLMISGCTEYHEALELPDAKRDAGSVMPVFGGFQKTTRMAGFR